MQQNVYKQQKQLLKQKYQQQQQQSSTTNSMDDDINELKNSFDPIAVSIVIYLLLLNNI